MMNLQKKGFSILLKLMLFREPHKHLGGGQGESATSSGRRH